VPVHRIRLRGPWDVRPHAAGPPGRMTIPATLKAGGWPGFTGRVSFYRRLGRPSNLSAGESVWLVFESVVGPARVVLNDEPLGELSGGGRYDVTGRLNERNTLEVVVDAADDQCGIVGEVTIEIRPARDAGATANGHA
jgi:hypothetical protein